MSNNDHLLTVIATATEEFLDEIRQRQSEPAQRIIAEFGERYPQIRENIDDLFPALIGVERLARQNEQQLSPASPTYFPELEDYQIVREIGRGGMGIVFEARQISLNRRVAIKTLSLDSDTNPEFLERFKREAQTAASIHHSNIVPVYEVGFENGVHFFSMQYIDGTNLSDLCRWLKDEQQGREIPDDPTTFAPLKDDSTRDLRSTRTDTIPAGDIESQTTSTMANSINSLARASRRPLTHLNCHLDDKQIARIGSLIADALHYIHQQGIVHRDIKPANILLDQEGTPWLADWGLVRSELSELTQTGELFGSLPYMAPERFRGQASATSDIYSLGVTLYELVTLRRIFEVQDQVELVCLIVNKSPSQPSTLKPTMSRDFENVILKAIDKHPEARYQSSAQFADDLRNVVAGHPVSARRLKTGQKLIRWCCNRPVVASLIGLATLLLIVGTTVSSIFAYQANQAKDLAKLKQRQSEASLDVFFGTFFPQATPDQGAKMTPAFRRAMDAAVDTIMGDEQYDAVVVGKLFNKLGWIYFNQQDYERALEVFQHSSERVSSAQGEDHEVAMMALDHVGMTLMRLDKHQEAETILNRAWLLQAETLGLDHENTIHTYAKLGDLYQQTGRYDESIKITEEVLEIRQRPGRSDAAFAAVSMNGLALSYIQKNQPRRAIELLELVVAKKEANNQIDLGFSYCLNNLAQAYRQLGDLETAKKLNDRCLNIRRSELPETADAVLSARTFAAGLMTQSGNGAAALPLLEAIWNDAKDSRLPFRRGMVLLEYGLCLKQLGQKDEALERLNQAWQILHHYRSANNLATKLAAAAIDELAQ